MTRFFIDDDNIIYDFPTDKDRKKFLLKNKHLFIKGLEIKLNDVINLIDENFEFKKYKIIRTQKIIIK